jgi:hypothetical protein
VNCRFNRAPCCAAAHVLPRSCLCLQPTFSALPDLDAPALGPLQVARSSASRLCCSSARCWQDSCPLSASCPFSMAPQPCSRLTTRSWTALSRETRSHPTPRSAASQQISGAHLHRRRRPLRHRRRLRPHPLSLPLPRPQTPRGCPRHGGPRRRRRITRTRRTPTLPGYRGHHPGWGRAVIRAQLRHRANQKLAESSKVRPGQRRKERVQ